jgi:3',5'-cyclic AMP phosphodiesterase CpdA
MKQRLLILCWIALTFALVIAPFPILGETTSTARSDSALNAPPSGPAPAGAVRFIALGDMGTGSAEQYAVARQMATYHDERPFDTVITLGDNIYPDGNPAHFISKFERPYAELLRRRVSFYASLGNHDVRRGRQAQMNYSHFNMGGRAYYSFTKGDDLIEFFALDSTDPDAEQAQWLERTLARSKARWKVAYFHHPVYSSGRTHGSDVKVRRQFEPLFVRYGLAAAIAGHDHFYERTKPQMGVQYFIAGAGGKLRRGNIDWRSPLLAAGDDRSNTFMYFEVTRDQIGFWAVDVTGRIADSGAITGSQLTLR